MIFMGDLSFYSFCNLVSLWCLVSVQLQQSITSTNQGSHTSIDRISVHTTDCATTGQRRHTTQASASSSALIDAEKSVIHWVCTRSYRCCDMHSTRRR